MNVATAFEFFISTADIEEPIFDKYEALQDIELAPTLTAGENTLAKEAALKRVAELCANDTLQVAYEKWLENPALINYWEAMAWAPRLIQVIV